MKNKLYVNIAIEPDDEVLVPCLCNETDEPLVYDETHNTAQCSLCGEIIIYHFSSFITKEKL